MGPQTNQKRALSQCWLGCCTRQTRVWGTTEEDGEGERERECVCTHSKLCNGVLEIDDGRDPGC